MSELKFFEDEFIALRVGALAARELPEFALFEESAQSFIATPVKIVVQIVAVADLRRHRDNALRGVVAQRDKDADGFVSSVCSEVKAKQCCEEGFHGVLSHYLTHLPDTVHELLGLQGFAKRDG